jgi:Family of unknown function (DUF6516)
VFNLLKQFNSIVSDIEVIRYEVEENQKRLHIKLLLIDDSLLIIKDYKFSDNTRKYSYHWMEQNGELRLRWDNVPHWKKISTFPNHKHVGKENKIMASTDTDSQSILLYIKEQLLK